MSDKSILHRFTPRPGEGRGCNSVPDVVETADDFGSFGWLRGIRDRAVMLELRKKNGTILAVGYGYLDHAEFDPSDGITLSVAGRKIKLKGRNLNAEVRQSVRFFEGITRHRVPWVQEASERESMEVDETATVVESVKW